MFLHLVPGTKIRAFFLLRKELPHADFGLMDVTNNMENYMLGSFPPGRIVSHVHAVSATLVYLIFF
jgi:hypothetical protein